MLNGKHGWFTQYEEAILVNRILRDDSTKGDMNNRQHVNFRGLWMALKMLISGQFMSYVSSIGAEFYGSWGFLRSSPINQPQPTYL